MRIKFIIFIFIAIAIGTYGGLWIRDGISPYSEWMGLKTVAQRISETQSRYDSDLGPSLKAVGITGNPTEAALLFFKDKKVLQLYVKSASSSFRMVKQYAVKAASGKAGPKLKSGDRQVPEGIYNIESLNPNSAYFLSLRLNYPNATDLHQAELDHRTDLGGDIMIHGSDESIGCIALGDDAIAEVFHLAGTMRFHQWKLLLAPTDLRVNPVPAEVVAKLPWMSKVYDQLAAEMSAYPNSSL